MKAFSLFLNVKGGFNNIHPSFLARTLRKAGISPSIRACIISFFSDRQVALIFQGGPVDFLPALMGTPQGSPLSPLLFLMDISHLHTKPHEKIMFPYIDDLALTVWSPSYFTNARRLKRWANILCVQGSRVRLGFSLPKTELVFAIGQGGAKICCPAPAPARVLAQNLHPAPPRRLIRGPAIEQKG